MVVDAVEKKKMVTICSYPMILFEIFFFFLFISKGKSGSESTGCIFDELMRGGLKTALAYAESPISGLIRLDEG